MHDVKPEISALDQCSQYGITGLPLFNVNMACGTLGTREGVMWGARMDTRRIWGDRQLPCGAPPHEFRQKEAALVSKIVEGRRVIWMRLYE